jgi:hypothetical protein
MSARKRELLFRYNALVKEAGAFTRSILNDLLYFGGL